MRYSIESRDYLSKTMDFFMDTGKNFLIIPDKTAWNRVIQETAESVGDLIGNKLADKIINKLVPPVQRENTTYSSLEMPKKQ